MNEFNSNKVAVILNQIVARSQKSLKYQAFEIINQFNLDL